MNSNKFELSGLILSTQDAVVDDNSYKYTGIQVIENEIASTIPVYIPIQLSNEIALHESIVIYGYLSAKSLNAGDQPQLLLIANHISRTDIKNVPEMPAEFMENPPFDENYFEPNNTESETYTLPLEAFTHEDENYKDQGVFITSDNRAIDLNNNELADPFLETQNRIANIDYEALWSMTSKDLIIEVLKRNHTDDQKKAMIGIALSKEITEKSVMSQKDLDLFFSKFSEIIKLGTRKFNGQQISFIRVRMSHYAGGQYIFRFISNIFNENPTSPMDWKDFAATYDHKNPRFLELQLQSSELENLFQRSESSEVLTTDLSEKQNKNLSINRAAKIRLNGVSPII